MSKKLLREYVDELDTPIEYEKTGLFKRNKFRLIIINEDQSCRDYFKKFPLSYLFKVKKKAYVLVPKAVIKGKNPTLVYFYNNPWPLFLKFEYSKVTALDMYHSEKQKQLSEEQKVMLKNIVLDSDSISAALNSRFLQGLYQKPGLSAKWIILIFLVIGVMVLIFLHAFGVINIFEILGAQQK